MGGSRRRMKKNRPKVRTGLPKRKRGVFKPSFAVPEKLRALTSVDWDEKGTVLKNYRSFGVVSNPNLLGARQRFDWGIEDPSLQLPPQPPQPNESAENIDPEFQPLDGGSDLEEDDLKSALKKKRRDGKRPPLQPLTTMQEVYVGRLIQKYGDDYQAMFWDIKLNAMQHSVSTLRSLCERFHAYEKPPTVEEAT
eukprot:TRINITY_DN9256_c0_g1_i1.p1 TRINITY_DN9256_c0_g1~~TRINITY_DN9256_c0_g1_i1.p1  ORF type:complete len:194 (-),score=23.69 TRINITY_DN9256_c0_g1_i1:480-1061(-)